MRSFQYRRSRNIEAALSALGERYRPLAGGTDMLPLLKADIQTVPGLVDIKDAGLSCGIDESAGEATRIGALTTLAELASNTLLNRRYALLGQAARSAATVQVRNRATLGGNLLQRPRCWYFRNPHARCWLKQGDDCPAIDGCNEHHAIFDDSPCKAAHPSDLAPCLLALNASVNLHGPAGERRLALADFYSPPEENRRRETIISDDELLTSVDIPAMAQGGRSIYLKAMDRKRWAFALVGLAVVLRENNGVIEELSIAACGLSPVPRRLQMCEAVLVNTRAGAEDLDAAAEALAREAEPLSGNAYKLDLSRRLLRKALGELLQTGPVDDQSRRSIKP